jgi:uncharacterized protein (TIGR02391 family)
MARQPPVPQSRHLSPRDIEDAIERIDRRLVELNAWDVSTVSKRNDPHIDELEAAIADTLVSTFGDGTPEYKIYRQARDLDTARHNYAYEVPWHEIAVGLAVGKERAIRLLSQARRSLAEKLGPAQDPNSRAIRAYDNSDLHPEIGRVATRLFNDGHYTNAVEASVKALNAYVRYRSGLDYDGMTLMERAFGPGNPVLKFNALADQSDKDEQKGFMMMFCGAVAGLRNPRAHGFINDKPERALEFIAYVSLLAKLVDGASN